MASYIHCNSVTAQCPVSAIIYGYIPSLPANATLLSIFSVVLVAQLMQGIAWKTWAFMSTFVLGSLCSVIGYAGRLVLHSNPWSYNGFFIQMICLTVAPIFYSAGIYLCYPHLVETFSPALYRISPRVYPVISISCNILPFILQGTGAILAAIAIRHGSEPSRGTHLMLAGLAFQVYALLLFGILCIDFVIRVCRHPEIIDSYTKEIRSSKRFRFFCAAISFAYSFIIVRCIYRITELSGWRSGELMKTENDFIVFEGGMVLAAAYSLSVTHPGYVFHGRCKMDEKSSGLFDDE